MRAWITTGRSGSAYFRVESLDISEDGKEWTMTVIGAEANTVLDVDTECCFTIVDHNGYGLWYGDGVIVAISHSPELFDRVEIVSTMAPTVHPDVTKVIEWGHPLLDGKWEW
jgi:hypothetical protein